MPPIVARARDRARHERRRVCATRDQLRHAEQERDRRRAMAGAAASWTVEYVLVCGDE